MKFNKKEEKNVQNENENENAVLYAIEIVMVNYVHYDGYLAFLCFFFTSSSFSSIQELIKRANRGGGLEDWLIVKVNRFAFKFSHERKWFDCFTFD